MAKKGNTSLAFYLCGVELSSKYLEKAVDEISGLPGIGRKTALRLALHLLRQEPIQAKALAESIQDLHEKVKRCRSCGNLSDLELCGICSDTKRDHSLVCVVEDIRDVMAIENTGMYKGVYHVLGALISPMEGVGPQDLNLNPLLEKVSEGKVQEMVMALSTTMEGETTSFYLFKALKGRELKVSVIARGIAMGDQLEYADEITLGRSILHRQPYEESLQKNRS